MNLLDENFPADQRAVLKSWHIACRQIGREVSNFGMQDLDILPLLHRFTPVTLFTQDQDFFKYNLCHSGYCLAWLDVKPGEAASYVRAFLRHPAFDTNAKRMGIVARVNPQGVQYWIRLRPRRTRLDWPE